MEKYILTNIIISENKKIFKNGGRNYCRLKIKIKMMQSFDDKIPFSTENCKENDILKPKPKKKTKELPPPRIQRSRSCSSLCKRQPRSEQNFLQEFDSSKISEINELSNELSKHTEENDQIDTAGNELINLISATFKLSSPKLTLSDSSTKNNNDVNENISWDASPTKEMHVSDMELQNTTSSTPNKQDTQPSSLINNILISFTNKFEEMMENQQKFQQQQQDKLMDYQQKLQEQILQLQQQHQQHQHELQILKGPNIVYEEIEYKSNNSKKSKKKQNTSKNTQQPKKVENPIQAKQSEHQPPQKLSELSQRKQNSQMQPATQKTTVQADVSKQQSQRQLDQSIERPAKKDRKPRKIDAMLLGSSIIKHIHGGNVKQRSGKYLKVACYPGADTEKVCDHAEVELKYAVPETAILHAGGNDLANHDNIGDICDNLAYLGLELKDRGVKTIAISGMTPRKNLKTDIPLLNYELKKMCKTYGYDYINNNNITFKEHLSNDQVHLNYDGVKILQGNYISYLNKRTVVVNKQ